MMEARYDQPVDNRHKYQYPCGTDSTSKIGKGGTTESWMLKSISLTAGKVALAFPYPTEVRTQLQQSKPSRQLASSQARPSRC
jgi:hypothetical protein